MYKRGEPIWRLGNSSITLYPIFMLIGIMCAFATICYFWKRQKYLWEILQILLIIVIPISILGARSWYVLFDYQNWGSMSFIKFFHFEGLAIQGGVIFGTLAGFPYLYSKRHLIDLRTAIGIIIPAIFIGQVIGRIGNFTNHEVYGPPVSGDSLNWLSWIGIKNHMNINGHYRAPFFLYEMFGTLSGYILVVWVLLYKNLVRPGVTAGLYLFLYGMIRVIMEPLRDEVDIIKLGNVQISTLMSILIIILGIFLVVWWQFFTRPLYSFIEKRLSQKLKLKITKEYELITPIKPWKKYLLFGKKLQTKKQFLFFGKDIPNHVRIWIPKTKFVKLSKKQINSQF